jgi:tetratricopeptide (TPR) repeat protein
VQLLWPKKDWDGIINLCKPAVQYNPEEMAFYYFMGLAYFQKDDEDKALDAFRRGVGEINSQSNPEIVSDFYALMGDILQKKGLMKQSYAAYDSCLQWKADHVSCLNNYAYFLSVQDTMLDKAEKMSFKTIKAEPKNSTYLDTYAWILFRQRRYSEAQIYIDQALKNDTDSVVSGVVLEHAGDIYFSLGQKQKALDYWLQAKKNGGASELLSEKIKDAQSYGATERKKKRK